MHFIRHSDGGNVPLISPQRRVFATSSGVESAAHLDAVLPGAGVAVVADLHEVSSRRQVGDDPRVAGRAVVVVLRDKGRLIIGAEQGHCTLGDH